MIERKKRKVEFMVAANVLIPIIGYDLGMISARKIDAVLDSELDEAKTMVMKAREENRYIALIGNPDKIKSVIRMENGDVYPSSFRVATLVRRIAQATDPVTNAMKE